MTVISTNVNTVKTCNCSENISYNQNDNTAIAKKELNKSELAFFA